MSDETPRVVVITGASQGIGASLVPAYRRLGYAVLGTSRTIPPSDDPMIATVQGDIATADTAERVTRHAIDRFGRIDTLINNAGVFVAKRFTQYTDEDYDLVTGVNLGGVFHITRRAIEHMERAGSGHVVSDANADGTLTSACSTSVVVMLTTWPLPSRSMCSIARRVMWKNPPRFTPVARS